jgi:hypothetical protein
VAFLDAAHFFIGAVKRASSKCKKNVKRHERRASAECGAAGRFTKASEARAGAIIRVRRQP